MCVYVRVCVCVCVCVCALVRVIRDADAKCPFPGKVRNKSSSGWCELLVAAVSATEIGATTCRGRIRAVRGPWSAPTVTTLAGMHDCVTSLFFFNCHFFSSPPWQAYTIVSVVSFAPYWCVPRSFLILVRTSGIHACAEFRTSAEVDWTQDRAPWSTSVISCSWARRRLYSKQTQ